MFARLLFRLTRSFPLLVVFFGIVAFVRPTLFNSLGGWISPALMIIMLSMGMTLRGKDFLYVAQCKGAVLLGLLLQYTVMPLAGLGLALLFRLEPQLVAGVVLVGSVAGGMASNVMTYLARGNVALSVVMTAISTLLGVVLTPLLSKVLVGQTVDVPALAMLLSLVKIVLIPLAVGLFLNSFAHRQVKKIEAVFPLISVLAITFVVAVVVALNAGRLLTAGPIVMLVVFLHNSTGLLAGFWITRLAGFSTAVQRTIALEVGLQNSGLATALAVKFFSASAAIPAAFFSVWHNVSGSLLAGLWHRRDFRRIPTSV